MKTAKLGDVMKKQNRNASKFKLLVLMFRQSIKKGIEETQLKPHKTANTKMLFSPPTPHFEGSRVSKELMGEEHWLHRLRSRMCYYHATFLYDLSGNGIRRICPDGATPASKQVKEIASFPTRRTTTHRCQA